MLLFYLIVTKIDDKIVVVCLFDKVRINIL